MTCVCQPNLRVGGDDFVPQTRNLSILSSSVVRVFRVARRVSPSGETVIFFLPRALISCPIHTLVSMIFAPGTQTRERTDFES